MDYFRHYSRWSLTLAICLALLLSACGSNPSTSVANLSQPSRSATTTASITPVFTPDSSANPTVTTAPVPTTNTRCPAPGSGRQAVFAPLALGHDPSIVYMLNQGTSNAPGLGELKRFDVVTGAKSELLALPATYITSAQLSADGQWLLFVALSAGIAKLQMLRLDGQGLQTLYCSNTISSIQWPGNLRYVIFASSLKNTIDLLDTNNGSVQPEVDKPARLLNWLDGARFYLSLLDAHGAYSGLQLLDIGQGPGQTSQSLPTIFQQPLPSDRYPCWSTSNSQTGDLLYVSQCHATFAPLSRLPDTRNGPSAISVQAATGGPQRIIFSSPSFAITTVRAITNHTLLFVVDNASPDGSINTRDNGIWSISTDGSKLLQLTTGGGLNTFSQDLWANVSRDGTLYAGQIRINASQRLFYGPLNGGRTLAFAEITGAQLALVGWTAS